jgi:hypothetical protein
VDRRIATALLLVAAAQTAFAVAFVFEIRPLVDVWPFPGTSPLSSIFVGSIFAAAAASTAWCVLARSDRALARPWRDPRPVPRLIRGSLLLFVVTLIIVGGLLAVRVPDIMPWAVTPQLSTLFGVMFLGAAAYFAYVLVEPRWENAGGQLAGFLAYDVVLVVPFVQRLPTVDQHLLPNLAVYTAVVIGSGLLAIWYVALDRSTGVRSGSPAGEEPTGASRAG